MFCEVIIPYFFHNVNRKQNYFCRGKINRKSNPFYMAALRTALSVYVLEVRGILRLKFFVIKEKTTNLKIKPQNAF